MTAVSLPTDAQARKNMPLVRGLLDYFPAALAEVANLSYIANEQHNPGEEMHWARGKSTDHADCIVRHLVDRGTIDNDNLRHSAKVAWRALALLQEELEAAGAPMARGARLATTKPLAWNEGWKCPRCGTNQLWYRIQDEDEANSYADGRPACNTPGCAGRMVRV